MPERYLGRQLGRFRIDEIVGSGGFAWVYRGYDPELDIPVAIKILKPQYAGEETFESRFRREASTAAKLRHPNIIRILAVGREDGAVYFVMDYLPASLDQRLKVMGTLPESLLVRLGMDVSAALAFAHREGVIHRDIKTDNILFDEHGNAIVADFGIARAVTNYVEQTGTNMVVGTPHYFSPEQARGQVLDGRADIYSLGVTMFRAATGVLPFQGDDWYEIARQHVEDAPPRPRSLNPALSRDMERVILRCLEKDPADRYATGDALHGELVQQLARTPTPDAQPTVVMPTPVAGMSEVPRPARRRAARSLAVAGVTAVGILIVLAGLRRARTHDAAATPAQVPAAAPGAATPDTAPPAAGVTDHGAPVASAATAGAVVPPAPRPELRITAPADSRVTVDGDTVASKSWKGVRLTPGVHRVVAAISTIEGCRWAVDSAAVTVPERGTARVTLAPHPCGTLSLDAGPAGAHWELTALDGTAVADGLAPQAGTIAVPSGSYVLRVSKSYCADYRARIAIPSGVAHRERVRLICGQ